MCSPATSETSLRRGLRVANVPARDVAEVAGTPGATRSTPSVPEPSAGPSVARASEQSPSVEPEAPPTEDIDPPPESPMKNVEGESSGGPSFSSVHRALTVKTDQDAAATASAQGQSIHPEPTAVDIHGSQVEGGVLSLLDKRELQVKAHGVAETGTDSVRLGFAPGVLPSGQGDSGPWSSMLWPEQRRTQRLEGVPESGESGMTLAQFPEMTNAEMFSYGRTQLERWMSVPPEVVQPVDVAYNPSHNGYDLWGFIRAAGLTARHLMSVTRSPSGRWLNVFRAERRRIPVVSDLRAVTMSLKLMPPVVCVAVLQTMLWEAGYEFMNRVPVWLTLSEVAWVPESQVRMEIERIGHFIGTELAAWNAAVGSTSYFVRQVTDPVLMASTTPSGLLVDGDGDALMDEDTQLFLGPEVVMRLQLTGLRPRSPVSSIEDDSSRKRPQLIRSEAGNSIPTWHGSITPPRVPSSELGTQFRVSLVLTTVLTHPRSS
ncbi:hypothetical protein PR003_g26074 [Phytophthora rubi]|uniref:Uncharacterized protein n=1 Tax=Phytophthora rubi TaxID=129364 RepID=A0A6A4CER7_9STRA|nr:hypothetical protein PR003_g26074 [Phytophthora rubi]